VATKNNYSVYGQLIETLPKRKQNVAVEEMLKRRWDHQHNWKSSSNR